MWEKKSSRPDPLRDAAWQWVQRQHDHGFSDAALNAALNHWLQADPAHARAYEEAARIWAVAGLVAPTVDHGQDLPPLRDADSPQA